MRYYTGIRLVDLHAQIYLFSTSSLAVDCFEDMSPFAASNFDSPTAAQTKEAGKRAVNATFARLPAAFSCNLETCQPLMEFARLLASQMIFSQFRRCLSCKVQMDQPSASRAERGTKAKIEAQLLSNWDFLWMRCEQDLCGSSFLEQAGEIEVVEATS